MVADLAVFLDYGHWHLVPALEQPLLQSLGLGLYLAVAIWRDTYLARYFSQENDKAVPMDLWPIPVRASASLLGCHSGEGCGRAGLGQCFGMGAGRGLDNRHVA